MNDSAPIRRPTPEDEIESFSTQLEKMQADRKSELEVATKRSKELSSELETIGIALKGLNPLRPAREEEPADKENWP